MGPENGSGDLRMSYEQSKLLDTLLSARIPEELAESIRRRAEQDRRSVSQIVRIAVSEYLTKKACKTK